MTAPGEKEVAVALRARFLREVASAGLPAGPGPEGPVAEADLARLPEPARRYLHFMGVVGRIRDWSFRLGFTGKFRLKPDAAWLGCEAWQYNSRLAVARIFHIRLRFGGLLSVLGRDTYLAGRGRMLIRPLDLFTLEDGTGEEYDIGELVTYLNDGVLVAPSMLLVPEVRWSPLDAASFELSLADHGRTVTARVQVDDRGAPVDFSTTDRFCYDPARPKRLMRARWSTPVERWEVVDGRPLPAAARAIWHLPQGPFAYADFRPIAGSLAFNVPPGS
jgi:hypothetical protein